MIFGITGSKITFMEGVIFWILFLLYLGYLYIMSKKGTEQEEENVKQAQLPKIKQAQQGKDASHTA